MIFCRWRIGCDDKGYPLPRDDKKKVEKTSLVLMIIVMIIVMVIVTIRATHCPGTTRKKWRRPLYF